ncbi:hypothetical protein GYMLUDRAFT_161489 [Collybiopsis luxurians FD-317 M1]|uniref:Protein-S-isoprenylcysteine O-methyltransferase n=1 Tax=Collybiopsis luxurians FD-317 M1 TaxID=944289 RepID=A0A0D0D456_9AGAR|nr:hypothetical protein GYMLUDRAFT_161489 [Collybiopsis luxurians FD-317 M1]
MASSFKTLSLLFKLPLLVSDAVCMRVSGTPPNPPTSSGRMVVPDWREHFLRSLAYPSKALRTMSWLVQFVEFIIIIAHFNSTGPVSNLILKSLTPEPSCIERIRITPLFMAGNVLNVAGTLLRIRCYRHLGHLFTFELRIQQHHQLITDGPYSYVRHPSYTALICTIVGALCSHASGSWVSECGLLKNPFTQILAAFWISVAFAVVLSLLLRVDREDAMLKKAFGDSWMQWSQSVPYKLVPGIY